MRYRTPLLVLAALLLLPAVSAAADDISRSGLLLSQDGSLLIVRSTDGSGLALYRINGSSVTLIASRSLPSDFLASFPATEPFVPPAKDAPGDDPPGFRRPARSVRISSAHQDRGEGEDWSAVYVVPSTDEEAYAAVRGDLQGWRIVRESWNRTNTIPRGDLEAGRGVERLRVSLFPGPAERWTEVRVSLTRGRP